MSMLILHSMPKVIFIFVGGFLVSNALVLLLDSSPHYYIMHFMMCIFTTKYSVKNDCINKFIYYIRGLLVIQPKHDDVIKWKHFPRYWPFVRGIHRWPVNSPHKGQWCGASVFSLICAWINGWVNNRELVIETPSHSLWRHCNEMSHYPASIHWNIFTIAGSSNLFYSPMSTQFRWMERNLTRRENSCGILQGSVFAPPFVMNPNMEPLEGNHPCHNMPA